MIELSKFYVVVANKKYNLLNHDYEIVLQQHSHLTVVDDVAAISIKPTFQFHLLADFQSLKLDCLYGWFAFVLFHNDMY